MKTPKWYRKARAYVHNVRDQTHYVRLRKVRRGTWVETDEALFEAVFELLVKFVELEKANMAKAGWGENIPAADEYKKAPHWDRRKNRQAWRERLGLGYLDWEISLEPSGHPLGQAEAAAKIKELYLWYKYERANRPDPWEHLNRPAREFVNEETGERLQEDEAFIELPNGFYKMHPMSPEYRQFVKDCAAMEDRFYEEDTEKAIEVLKIRSRLWT